METSVKERLVRFIKQKGLTVREFERSIGVSNGYVSKITGTIGADKLHRMGVEYPELNVDWLMLGVGDMLKDQKAGQQTETPEAISRLIEIMEKDRQLIRDMAERKDEEIDRLLSIMEADRGIYRKEKTA